MLYQIYVLGGGRGGGGRGEGGGGGCYMTPCYNEFAGSKNSDWRQSRLFRIFKNQFIFLTELRTFAGGIRTLLIKSKN